MSDAMRILLTGATGFLGVPLVKVLLGEGHEVTVVSRDPERARRRMPAACSFVAWMGDHPLHALAGHDVVVHLAGEPVAGGRWTAARKEAIRSSRVDTSRSLVEAIAALPAEQRPRVLVSASATGFYGDRGDEVVDESSPAGSGFLADVCRAWEAEIQRAEPLVQRAVCVRIGVVLGRGGGALGPLLPVFRLGVGGKVGSGRQWFSWIHLEDMVRLLHFAITADAARGVLNGTAPEPVTNAEFTRVLAAAVHRPAILPAPAAVLRLALGEMATILLGGQRVEPRATLAAGFTFRFPHLAGALADLCSVEESLLEREQWFDRPAAELFPFFGDAFNLEQITPGFVHFRVLGTSTENVGPGTLIDYRLRLHGFPVRWQSRIDEWRPATMFRDSQVSGPYALWEHTHFFEASRGGTLVRDRVRYRLPLGAVGELVAGGLVRRDLDAIFDFRHAQLARIFAPQEEPR